MEHVNNKISQIVSQYKGVVSWLKTWWVHVAKEVKGSTPSFYMPKVMCEDGVWPKAMECVTTHHELGG
jgi:hypothetical protein